jgi:hypothetical protein
MTYTCVPYGNGIPAVNGQWSGPPIWWNASGPVPALNTREDDPRWRGAVQRTYLESGSGAAFEHGIFRALNYPDAMSRPQLYLSWRVLVDPGLEPGLDRIYLGLQRTGAAEAFVIKMPAFQVEADATAGNAPGTATYKGTQSGTDWTWAQLAAEPAWIGASLRSWVNVANSTWALELMIPLHTTGAPADHLDDGGFDLGDPFNLWYEVHVATPAGGGGAPYFHTWPRTGIKHVIGSNFPAPTGEAGPPASAAWPQFKLSGVQWDGGPPTDPLCEPGVSITPSDVFTDNADPVGIEFSSTSVVTNTFHAKPLNQTGGTIAAGDIEARFRMANWGSNANWEDVPDPSLLWADIRGGGAVTGAQILNNNHGDLTFDWRLNAAEIAEFEPPPTPPERREHQCVLVELSGGGLNFRNASVFRNMNVAHASDFEEPASISVKGPGSLATPGRNVYLYLQTMNMPKTIKGGQPPRRDEVDTHGRTLTRAAVRYDNQAGAGYDDGEGEPPVWDVSDSDDAGTFREVAKVAPTYMVHVFHETGETILDDDGRTKPVLRAQTSFGYFVEHSGPLYGWDAELDGVGLEKIAPNFYKLVVPHEGVVDVTTRIKGWEKPRPWYWSCLTALLAIPILGVIVRALMKSNP